MVHGDGTPAPGVKLTLRGSSASTERHLEFGAPEDWPDLELRTDAQGRFEFSFEPPPAFDFVLDSYHDGSARMTWWWESIEPESVSDLGRIVLQPSGSLRVTVAGLGDLESVEDPWVFARCNYEGSAAHRRFVREPGAFDAETQRWLIDDLPAGTATVAAQHPLGTWAHREVSVVAGETTTAELTFDSSAAAERIVVAAMSWPLYRIAPRPRNVMLVGGPLAKARRFDGEPFGVDYAFENVAPGEYTVVVDDPNFERWEQSGVEPGQRVVARLTGSASIELDVTTQGQPVADWSLTLRCLDERVLPPEIVLVNERDAPPADGLIRSLVPMDYVLLLEAPGLQPVQVPVDRLASGERRVVRVEMSREALVAGVVVDADGDPVEGLSVEAYRAEADSRHRDWWSLWGERKRDELLIARTVTAGDGRFSMSPQFSGEMVLRAWRHCGVQTLQRVTPGDEALADGIRLQLPDEVWFDGQIDAPAGASLDGLQVVAGVVADLPDSPPSNWDATFNHLVATSVAPDGTFQLGPFPLDTLEVAVLRQPARQTRIEDFFDDPWELWHEDVEADRAGRQPLAIDLTHTWPGRLEVRVRVNGLPLEEGVVWLDAQGPGRWGSQAAAAELGDGGAAVLEPRGGLHHVIVCSEDRRWSWRSPDAVEVRPLVEHRVDVDCEVAEWTVTVVDETSGEPLRSAALEICWGDRSHPRRIVAVETDPDGRMTLEAPLGPVPIGRPGAWRGSAPDRTVNLLREVDWTADGPIPAVVELP